MIIIGENRWLAALLKSLLLFAFVHISVLIIYFIISKDLDALNLFNILGFNLFFPNIVQGGTGFILSAIALLAVYLAVFTFFTKSDY